MQRCYDDLIRQTDSAGRSLNKSLMVLAGDSKRKIVNMSVQRVGEGEDAQFVHVFQDCADLRTMEERLVQSERLATIGRFASQIAHEIRNPLSSITLNVELLEDEVDSSNDEAQGLIRSVLKELDRLERYRERVPAVFSISKTSTEARACGRCHPGTCCEFQSAGERS